MNANPVRLLMLLFLSCLILFTGCEKQQTDSDLFEKFQNPPAEARPMVRWWWNGNCVEAEEIKRELRVMHEAGIGGVEINSIAMPPHARETGAKALQWAGPEWINAVRIASEEARELGMITDLIVGSGWPFGGQFLEEDETMQRLGIKKLKVEANSTINLDLSEYLKFKSQFTPGTVMIKEFSDVEIVTVKLIPTPVSSLSEIIDLTGEVTNNQLNYETGDQEYFLVCVYNERNFKSVYHGSPGADGPIMDHYKADVVLNYLNRLKAIEKETGLSLAQLIRALFCDSIELGGSNWTDDMKSVFQSRNGYDITPYLPFVIQPYSQRNTYETSAGMADTLKRVQYDFYNTLISVFLERFTAKFQEFCTENGVLCRYQAYGTPYYMGLFQGNMIPDIPESNNWIYSRGRNEAGEPAYNWSQNHGYMLWNKAASSGGHIMGRKIVSCEAMTNTQGVFRTSLETVKQSDDMNFITGMNHAVLHGYNYSPLEAGFPGWMRYGAYFSEQNTWWKYFKHWADYNARLSAVFQNSRPTAEIAILGRLRDFWSEYGAVRPVFNANPWYYAKLWEPISNLGSSCDYIHQPVLENAGIDGKQLVCGEMRYSVLLLTDVESVTPEAAKKIGEYALTGGKIVVVGTTPYRSLSLKNANENDAIVDESLEKALAQNNVIHLPSPEQSIDLLVWVKDVLARIDHQPGIKLEQPVQHLYTLRQTKGDQDILFLANSHRKEAVEVSLELNSGDMYPCLWDAETGERFALNLGADNKLQLTLDALESALLVLEPEKMDLPAYESRISVGNGDMLETSWIVSFDHINGTQFTREWEALMDFSEADDEEVRTFAGTVSYSTTIENDGEIKLIRLSEVNEGVTELYINGEHAGIRWYGSHTYPVNNLLKEGINTIEIRLTNTLANYCQSLDDNPTAKAWTSRYDSPFPAGLAEVEIIK